MNRSTPGLPAHHQLPEFTQTHAHRVSDTIQPSHPWSSLSPPALNPSQHQSLFQWVLYFPPLSTGIWKITLLNLFTKTLWNKWSRDQLIEITAIHLFCESPTHRNFYQVTDSLWFFSVQADIQHKIKTNNMTSLWKFKLWFLNRQWFENLCFRLKTFSVTYLVIPKHIIAPTRNALIYQWITKA